MFSIFIILLWAVCSGLCVGVLVVGAVGWVVGGINCCCVAAGSFHANFCNLCYLRLTIGYLNHSWGVGPNTFKRWERQQADATAKAVEAALEPPAEQPFSGNVIVNRALAAQRHTAQYLYAVYQRQIVSSREAFACGRKRSPQLPISNTCDLYVFPLMARQHAHLCRVEAGKSVASTDVIWEKVQEVWRNMPSADIAMAHVLAYRVMGKVVASGGKTDFLDDDGIHTGLRRDFTRTDRGIERAAGRPALPAP